MTTRIRFSFALALSALAVIATVPAPVNAMGRRPVAQDDAASSMAQSQLAARRGVASKDLALEPLVDQALSRPQGQLYDIGIVPFKHLVNKQKGGMIYDRTRQYFTERGFKLVPRDQVEAAIKELGLLSNEAIQQGDCESIARALGVRYLAFGTTKLAKTDTGFSPVGGAVSSATAMMGGLGGLAAASAIPFVAGALAVSAVGGFTTAANVDLECRIYDRKVQKMIWVGTESFVAKKHLWAVFADKKKLQEQALTTGLRKLFDPIVSKLQPMRGHGPSVD